MNSYNCNRCIDAINLSMERIPYVVVYLCKPVQVKDEAERAEMLF